MTIPATPEAPIIPSYETWSVGKLSKGPGWLERLRARRFLAKMRKSLRDARVQQIKDMRSWAETSHMVQAHRDVLPDIVDFANSIPEAEKGEKVHKEDTVQEIFAAERLNLQRSIIQNMVQSAEYGAKVKAREEHINELSKFVGQLSQEI